MPRKPLKDPGPRPAATPLESADPIARFLVMSFDYKDPDSSSNLRTRIYLLPPRANFPGFGGSKSGLFVGNTPSMVMRQTASWGTRDVEYDLADPDAWGYINWLAQKAMAQGTYHHIGTWKLIDPSQHPKV
jgi:hypothetical protein